MKPITTGFSCAWCNGGPIEAIGEPEWSDNTGEGGNGIGRWYQVYIHPDCTVDKIGRWTYIISYEKPQGSGEGDGK